jgi:large subunit ribosomal protein L25
MEKVTLQAEPRTITGKQVGALRRQGKLPAVLYGHHFEPTPVVFDLKSTQQALSGLSSSSLVTIVLNGAEHAALVREKQKNYITNTLLHVDFQVVSLTEKIRASVAIELTGSSPAVQYLNGVVINGLSTVEVECLPQDMPEKVIVDISSLAKIGDGLYVRDVKFNDNIQVLSHPDEMVVIVTGVSATEEEAAEATAEAAEPEVIEKGKKEEEEAE